MKLRVLILSACILMVSFSVSYSIERISRASIDSNNKTADISVQRDSLPKGRVEGVEGKAKMEQRQERYDNFLDRNNNGIDDSLEKEARKRKVFFRGERNEQKEKQEIRETKPREPEKSDTTQDQKRKITKEEPIDTKRKR